MVKLIIALLSLFMSLSAQGKDSSGSNSLLWQTEFQDLHGESFKLGDFKGQYLVLSFFFTRCPSACPMQAARLAKVAKRLPSSILEKVSFVSISIDPDYDKQGRIKDFAAKFKLNLQHWKFGVNKDKKLLDRLLTNLDVKKTVEDDEDMMDHQMTVYLLSPDQKIVQRYSGNRFKINRMVHDIKKVTTIHIADQK